MTNEFISAITPADDSPSIPYWLFIPLLVIIIIGIVIQRSKKK